MFKQVCSLNELLVTDQYRNETNSFRDVGTVYIYRSLFYLLMVKFWNTTPLSLRIFWGGGGSLKYF